MCRPGDHVILPGDAYGGTYRLVARVLHELGAGVHAGAARRPRRGARRGPAGPRRCIWCETPTNPLLGIADIAALADDRARRPARCWSSTTRSPRRTCSSRSRSAPTWSCTRRRSTSAATPTWSAARWSRPTPSSGRSSRSTRTRWARSPGRSTPGWCCAASRRSACGWTGTAATPSASSSCCVDHPAVSQVLYPGLPSHPGHEVAAQADARTSAAWCRSGCAGGEEAALKVCELVAAVHPRRVARRRRVADRAPGPDDARQRRRLAARGAGRPGPAVGRHRGHRGPAGRPHPGARLDAARQALPRVSTSILGRSVHTRGKATRTPAVTARSAIPRRARRSRSRRSTRP